MQQNRMIKSQIAVDDLLKLINVCKRRLDNTPMFLEEERQNLEMEMQNYRIHIGKLNEVHDDV